MMDEFSDEDEQPANNNNNNNNGPPVQPPPPPPPRKEPFMPRVELRPANLQCLATGVNAAEAQEMFADMGNDMENIVSLETLINSPTEDYRNKIMVLQLLSVSKPSGNNPVTINSGNRNGGRKGGAVTMARYNRLLRFICFQSSTGSNTLSILEGSGHGQRLWNLDILSRDNGIFRKYS